MLSYGVKRTHMNTRFLVTGLGENRKFWFGGGCDLTPMLPDKKSAIFFHKNLNLRKINFKAFNKSLINFNNLLK